MIALVCLCVSLMIWHQLDEQHRWLCGNEASCWHTNTSTWSNNQAETLTLRLYLYAHTHTYAHMHTWWIWSSKDVLFWEQLRVSHPTLVTDGETGCKYQTLYKHRNMLKHPRKHTNTYTHTDSHSRSPCISFFSLSLNSEKHLAKGRMCCFKLASLLLLHQQLMYDHSSSDSFVKNTKKFCSGSLKHNAQWQDAGIRADEVVHSG